MRNELAQPCRCLNSTTHSTTRHTRTPCQENTHGMTHTHMSRLVLTITPLNLTWRLHPTHSSAGSSTASANSALPSRALGHCLAMWPRSPQLKHLPRLRRPERPLAPEHVLLRSVAVVLASGVQVCCRGKRCQLGEWRAWHRSAWIRPRRAGVPASSCGSCGSWNVEVSSMAFQAYL